MAESYFIAKVYRQHNSSVIAVPQAVCIALGLKPGDHMVFTWQNSEGRFKASKFKLEGVKDAGDSEHADSEDRSRATPAAVGGRG